MELTDFRRDYVEPDGQDLGQNVISPELSRHSHEDAVLHLGYILKCQLAPEYHGEIKDVVDTALHAIRSNAITNFSDLTEFITKRAFEQVRCV